MNPNRYIKFCNKSGGVGTILKTIPTSLATASHNTARDMKPKPSSIGIAYAGTGNSFLYIASYYRYLSADIKMKNYKIKTYY